MSDEIKLDKAESLSPKLAVGSASVEVGQPHIITSSRYIQDQRKAELAMPRRFCTFDAMMLDDAVYNSVDVTNALVLESLDKGKFVAPKGSVKGKIAADFLNYSIRNMTFGTWRDAISSSCSDLKHGFSLLNLVTEKRKYGKYKGNWVIKKLAPRTQSSVYGWVFDKNNRDLKGFVQKPMLVKDREPKTKDFAGNIPFNNISNGVLKTNNYPFIDSKNLLHFRYNPVDDNPQGDSPLLHCYDAWKEKKLIEQYEVIGVSKDMSGVVVVDAPPELIEKAADPSNYPAEYAAYQELQKNAAALQAGTSALIVLSSAIDPTTKGRDYDISFKGIDGGGKQYKTSEIIDQKRKSIYNVFGAGFLLLGQSGHGSNALSSNQMTTHDYYVERNVGWKVDAINSQLVPRLLAINNIELDWEDLPKFETIDPSKPDIEAISKAIQRLKATGAMTPAALTKWYEDMGLPIEGIEDLVFDDGDTSDVGRASDGTSGNGTSQSGGASSDSNSDNAA